MNVWGTAEIKLEWNWIEVRIRFGMQPRCVCGWDGDACRDSNCCCLLDLDGL